MTNSNEHRLRDGKLNVDLLTLHQHSQGNDQGQRSPQDATNTSPMDEVQQPVINIFRIQRPEETQKAGQQHTATQASLRPLNALEGQS